MIHFAIRNLFRNLRSTFTIVLIVAIGVSSLYVLRAFNAGLLSKMSDAAIHTLFGDGQIFTENYKNNFFEKPWEHWIANYSEIEKKLKSHPKIKHLFPRIRFHALVLPEDNSKSGIGGVGEGVDGVAEAKFFTGIKASEGVLLREQENGIMLGHGLAKALGAEVGSRVTLLVRTVYGYPNGIDLYVCGIFKTGSKLYDSRFFRIPIKQAQKLMDTPTVEAIGLGLDSHSHWPEVASFVEKTVPKVDVYSMEQLNKIYYKQTIDWLKSQFQLISLIVVIIVLLGIFNTVSTAVLDRKQEIGNLRANGESTKDVLTLLTLEGLFQGLIGSIIGLFIAWFICTIVLKNGLLMPPAPGMTRRVVLFFILEPSYGVAVFLMGWLSASVATVLAGLKISKMQIADALRSV